MKICLVCEGVASTELTVCASCGGRLLRTSEIHFPVRRGDEDAAHPLLGTLVDGKYRVTGVLGRGGMGTVFRATHEVSLVPLALKLLHPRLASRAEYRTQFLAEARKAGRVVHEHTARILDVGETQNGAIYIAQELVSGITLHEWQQAGEPLSPEVLVEILGQVCSALVAAHAVGLVHRDLTPRNIMVEVRQGRPHAKVLDFGLARGVAERAPGGGEEGVAAFASPPYAAPEHLAGQDVDGRADLYGFGVIAFEALCGFVPTPGATPREFAAATLSGELLPFAPRVAVPKRLARLLQQLLARDPAARPSSAAVVLAELEAIAAPRAGRLRALALVTMLLAVITFAVAFRGGPPAPYLRLAPQGQELDLLESMPRGAKVQPLRSAALRSLLVDFGGFDARRLTVEVWHSGEAVDRQELRPDVRGHTLTLDVAQPSYANLLETIKVFSQQGPVYLKFVVAGSPPLAYAALRIDDDPPQAALSLHAAGADGAILADTELRIAVDDRQPKTLLLCVEHDGNEQSLPLEWEARPVPARAVIDLFPPPLPARDVVLHLRAEDAAGNVTRSAPVRCPTVDLGVPGIARVVAARAQARTLLVGTNGVRLHVQLQGGREPDLEVTFAQEGRVPVACVDVVAAGDGLDATWPWPAGVPQPPDGSYQLVLRDPAGNRAEFTDAFTFVTRGLEPALAVAPDAQAESAGARLHAVIAASGILSDGLPIGLDFTCNAFYRPITVEVVLADGGQGLARGVRLDKVRDGAALVCCDELSDGRYRLGIRARAQDGDEQSATYALLVQREPMTLRLPASTDKRFLPQLADIGALQWRDGRIGEGRAWNLLPADARWLRGSIWFGRGRPTAHALPERAREQDPLLPDLQPWPGENVLGICLRDALHRPVRVLRGDALAPPLADLSDERRQPVVEVVRFFWHTQAPRPRSSEVWVEHGQPARFIVDAPLPYNRGDTLELLLDTMPCRPKAITPAREGGVSVEFELPFAQLLAVARFNELTAEQFAENRESEPFALWLIAPDGRYEFKVRARTSRTTLEPVRLGDVALSTLPEPLPAALSSLLMVPILGPGLVRPWRDPVPVWVSERAAFRAGQTHDVRNVGDCYLQQHETTRVEYAQVADAILALALRDALPVEELVHRGDPLGASRLRRTNLVPRAWRGDEVGWQAAVRSGPDRAVAGVDFFQAYVFTRAAGWLLAREPALFRLPTGVELELAAFGSAHLPSDRDVILNGAARHGGVRVVAALAAATQGHDPRSWPPTARELVGAGDRVVTELGVQMTGLDFGVREWVADLPAVGADTARSLASSSDHVRQLEGAAELARELPHSDLERALLRFAVARGLALDELPGVHPADQTGTERCSARVPGVVRVLQLARDGGGMLPGEIDPHLPVIGLRLCGGRAFLQWVRSR